MLDLRFTVGYPIPTVAASRFQPVTELLILGYGSYLLTGVSKKLGVARLQAVAHPL
jgi:hypothetical protein